MTGTCRQRRLRSCRRRCCYHSLHDAAKAGRTGHGRGRAPAAQAGSRGGPPSTAHGPGRAPCVLGGEEAPAGQGAGLHPTRRRPDWGGAGAACREMKAASAEPDGPKSKVGHTAAWGAAPCRAARHFERPGSAYSMQPAARQVARSGASRDGELPRPTHVGEAACGPASPGAAYTNLNRPVRSATAWHRIAQSQASIGFRMRGNVIRHPSLEKLMVVDKGENVSSASKRQGSIRTTAADVQPMYMPPPSAPTITSATPTVLQMPELPRNADDSTTSSARRDFVEPRRLITIRDRNLEDSYIDELMKNKGLGETQMSEVRSALRQYIDTFIGCRGIELDDGAYALLTNMLIHLIEESSKGE